MQCTCSTRAVLCMQGTCRAHGHVMVHRCTRARCEHLVPHWREQRGEGRARQDAGDEGDGPRCHRVGTLCRGEAPVRAPPPRSERESRGKRQKKGAFSARRGHKKEKKGARIRTSLAAPPPGSYGRPVRYQSTSFCSNDSLGRVLAAQSSLPCLCGWFGSDGMAMRGDPLVSLFTPE